MTIHIQRVDITIGDGLTVATDLAKMSLIFDTLHDEARRRFAEIYVLGSSNLRLSSAQI